MQRAMCHTKEKGFTLVEMIVVIGLVVLLSGVAAVYNKAIGRQIVVSQEHAKALVLFMRARSAGFTIPKVDTTVEFVCAYGVHVDPATKTIVFFKDLGTLPGSCVSANHRYDGDAERIDQIVLKPTITLTAERIADVVFVPPYGEVIITDTDGITVSQSGIITVASESEGLSRSIKVNAFGQISEFTPTP